MKDYIEQSGSFSELASIEGTLPDSDLSFLQKEYQADFLEYQPSLKVLDSGPLKTQCVIFGDFKKKQGKMPVNSRSLHTHSWITPFFPLVYLVLCVNYNSKHNSGLDCLRQVSLEIWQ